MPARLFVLGHRNPDTDAICATIGYATLLRLQQHYDEVVDGRLGPPPRDRLSPRALRHSRAGSGPQRVPARRRRDDQPAVTACLGESLYEVGQKIDRLGDAAAPVVDDAGRFQGIAEARDFARPFFGGLDDVVTQWTPLHLDNIIRAVGGTVLVAAPDRQLHDRVMVAAMSMETILKRLEPDILLVVGDRTDVQLAAIERGVGALIVTHNLVSARVIDAAISREVNLIAVSHHTYRTVQLINMSIPIDQVMRVDQPFCSADDLVEDVRSTLTTVRSLPFWTRTTASSAW